MIRDADKKTIGIWLECFNGIRGTTFRVESYPDESDRNAASIDAMCKDSSGKMLGVEHTRIEAFPGEMTDNARFMEVLGALEKNPSLAEVGFMTTASIAVGSIPKGISWTTLSRDVVTFLQQKSFGLGKGMHTLTFMQGEFSFPVRIEKMPHLPFQPGVFLVARHWPGKSNNETLKKAFEEKLPKLKAAHADNKILLLEQNSVAGSVLSDVGSYVKSQGLPTWLPDEIWVLWTAALETEQFMHVSQIHPMTNKKASWKSGSVTLG